MRKMTDKSRGLGLAKETLYGTENNDMQYYHHVKSLNANLKSENITIPGSFIKGNVATLKGNFEGEWNTEFSGSFGNLPLYLYLFFGNYKITEATVESVPVKIHEFWGGNSSVLPSTTLHVLQDMVSRFCRGAVLDKLNIDVSTGEALMVKAEGLYMTERNDENVVNIEQILSKIPVGEYIGHSTIDIELNNEVLFSKDLGLELNNNHNTDNSKALGQLFNILQPNTAERQIEFTVTPRLSPTTKSLLLASKYGTTGVNEPTKCSIYNIPASISMKECSANGVCTLDVIMPSCTVSSDDFETSEMDDAEIPLSLVPENNKKVTMYDNTQVTTDIYARLVTADLEEVFAVEEGG